MIGISLFFLFIVQPKGATAFSLTCQNEMIRIKGHHRQAVLRYQMVRLDVEKRELLQSKPTRNSRRERPAREIVSREITAAWWQAPQRQRLIRPMIVAKHSLPIPVTILGFQSSKRTGCSLLLHNLFSLS
jgi:hypothetical protein